MSWKELTLFNVADAFCDGIVRGYTGGLLRQNDYENLTQCPDLEDMRMHLQTTDYGNFLANEPQLAPSVIQERATDRMVEEFKYLRGNASETLATFLDYITHPFMIDNVILIITGTLHDRPIAELLDKCHPLGKFEGMSAVALASSPEELYHTVLVETPVGKYFSKRCFQYADMTEGDLEVIRNLLYKAYYEDFAEFCIDTVGGITGEVMRDILEFEADRRVINITLNALDSELTKDEVRTMYPAFGLLFPFGQAALEEVTAKEMFHSALHGALKDYQPILENANLSEEGSIDEAFTRHEIELNKASFDQQFHYGVFYSYFRLKEQEIRNITLIAECIQQKNRSRINNFVPIF